MKFDDFLRAAAKRPPAIVLHVAYACGIGIIRDLGRHGVPVLGLDVDPRAIGLSSRYAAGMVSPDPLQDEAGFLAFLEDLGRRLPRKAVLFPAHDEFIWPVSHHAERLGQWFIIPFSRWETMQRLHDRKAQLEAAQRAGVGIPKTVFIDAPADLERGIAEITFPAIFKPVESLAFNSRFQMHVLEIQSPEDLTAAYAKVDDRGTLMLQEIVPGGDEELWTLGSYLDAASRPLAVFTGHKLRQHPRRFGYCRFAVSDWDADLADAGLRLLQELRYHGVSQVEFKRDTRDGSFRLMEINARHWMWHSLAAACGVNLSLAAYRDAIGQPFIAPRQKDGRKWSVAIKDFSDSVREVRRHELGVMPWLGSYHGLRVDGVLSFRDPLPGLKSVRRIVRRLPRGAAAQAPGDAVAEGEK
jgi:D-aspartate ligase